MPSPARHSNGAGRSAVEVAGQSSASVGLVRRSRVRPLARPLRLLVLTLACVAMVACVLPSRACTTIIVGRQATVDGSMMTTHNNDCEDCDVRLGVVPGRPAPLPHRHRRHADSASNSSDQCPIYPCGFSYPRYVGYSRGETYYPQNLESLSGPELPETQPLGFIPESEGETFRYLDGTYGMMNEKGLAMGESTCGAKIVAYSVAQGGDALFDISALARLALQRCATARCAIHLIGGLAEQYGYAGSEDPVETGTTLFELAGEALTMIDTSEAWVFHILADPSGTSAIWAAQRVPEDHLAVVPNKFIIDAMNLTDTDNFLASKDIRRQALAGGFLNQTDDRGDEAFEFSRAFALDYVAGSTPGEQLNTADGERRRWRIFSLVAPSRRFQPDQSDRFPFSVAVEKKLAVEDIQSLMRDHFEGTPFDSTSGLAAGPFGNPNRYDRDSDRVPEVRAGFFERTISIHRTSYSFVAVTHPDRPLSGVLWLAHHSPQTSLYLPLYASTLALPPSFARGSLFQLTRDSAWWAFCAVANNAERMYAPIHAAIAEVQQSMEKDARVEVAQTDAKVDELIAAGEEDQAIELMTAITVARAQASVDRWWRLLDELTTTFRDGMKLKSRCPPLELEHIFYPLPWLKQVGYFDHGSMGEPRYPPLPMPRHVVNLRQQAQEKTRAMKTETTAAATPTVALADRDTELVSSSVPVDLASGSSSSTGGVLVARPWLSGKKLRLVAICMFAFIFVLLAIVCFLLGRMYGRDRRTGYAQVLNADEEAYPTGGGYGATSAAVRHELVQPPPRVATTTRNI